MNHEAKSARSGAAILADLIQEYGHRHVFQIPGEGILEPLDALATRHPEISLVTFRHEAGMTYAAQAYARLGDRPSVCMAGRAPGALNTALALHTADTDGAAMILVVGQPAVAEAERDPMSGFDLQQALRPLVKEVITVTTATRLQEGMMRAWCKAGSGRPGPVVLVVTENVWREDAICAPLPAPSMPEPAPALEQIAAVAALLRDARRPLVLVGGSGWNNAARLRLHALAQSHNWPVVAGYRRADLFDNADPHYAGELGIGLNPMLAERIAQADLILAINIRLGEINTFGTGGFGGFRLLDAPRPAQRLVHVHVGADELNRVYRADVAIQAAPGPFLGALSDALSATSAFATDAEWPEGFRIARDAFIGKGGCPGPVDLRKVFTALRERLPDDTIFTVGAGAYAIWLHRYFAFRLAGTILGPKSGAMGYGLPAAIGAAMARPDRLVVAAAGDGCLLMHGEELATAVQQNLRIIVIVINNQGYGAIRSAQLRQFGRPVGTALRNPDFVAYAAAFGALAERVQTTSEFLPALKRVLNATGPALIEIAVPDTVAKPE
ncbi:Acetolactate synthase large subunit [Cupriavidus taiwanensis]|uniref:thiamine pyrophosphate-dependent enzyme n=1 Tax=Cupriavidus taiwanensis TaxID=164546 RepID=UPI000E117EED|nr:thiamine pyrophosphate-dependent enzyme [Cupriavidus taiwanensis]SPA02631.1 Acetolactate synthase large subunit [Cupriavidus taiwanensis]